MAADDQILPLAVSAELAAGLVNDAILEVYWRPAWAGTG